MKISAKIAAVVLACFASGAQAGQYSDMWWNPAQSGWGMGVVQQLETAFVTLYVYGADGRPTWYVGPSVHVYAYSSAGLPQFSGTLYRTTGPWHGGAFDPASVQVSVAGTLALEVRGRNSIRVTYTADGATVTRDVVRQTWEIPILAANYQATFSLRQSVPGHAPFGTLQYTGDALMHVDEGRVFLRVDDQLGRRCEYRGPYTQTGKLAEASGTFSCVPVSGSNLPASGTFQLNEVDVAVHGITGVLRTFSASLNESGRFAALRF